jgi:hypothetical protein
MEDSGVAPAAAISALIGDGHVPNGAAEVDVMDAPKRMNTGQGCDNNAFHHALDCLSCHNSPR